MLNEEVKLRLRSAVAVSAKVLGEEVALETFSQIGPVAMIDYLIIEKPEDYDPGVFENLVTNREEAERYVAGLYGMC